MENMRKTRSFVAMAVLLACLLAITACGNGNVVAAGGQEESADTEESISLDVEAQLAGVEIVDHTGEEEHVDYDALPDIDVDSGAVWTDSNPESVPEPESATSVSEPEPEPEVPEPEPETEYQNPGMHSGYLNVVGDARFYTEHDISQWLRPDEDYPEYFDFDIYQMLVDLWCEDGGGVSQSPTGFHYTDGIVMIMSIIFEGADTTNDRLFHEVKIWDNRNGTEAISIVMHDCPRPEGGYYYILDEWNHVLHPDLAPLILFAAEQMVTGSPYEALSGLNLGQNFSVY